MPLSARVSGYVTKVNVDDNQYVAAGTVLVEIDPRDYQVAVDQAKAAVEDARATAQASNLNVPDYQRKHRQPDSRPRKRTLKTRKRESPLLSNNTTPLKRSLPKLKPMTQKPS